MQDVPLGRERVSEIYSRIAPFYDEVTREAEHRPKQRALELLRRTAGEIYLDVGIGTGVSLADVVSTTGAAGVIGVDFAAGMLDLVHQHFHERGLESPLLLLADATALPVAPASIDCLFSSYVLNVMPFAAVFTALVEFRRVLHPGGRLALVNLTEGEGEDAAFIADWKRRFEADPESMSATRPLQAASLVLGAGFEAVHREYVGGPDSWPAEVLIARR